ncbi:translation initiation factor IF-2 [bacterium]|nr:translation initiation factor IF-2 [bacterium]
MTSKKRVYSVAKEFNMSNETLIEFLHKQGVKVRNHMAPVSDEMYALINENFQRAEDLESKEPDFRKKIQEKKIEEEKRRETIREEINEILERSKGSELEPVSTTGKKRARKRSEEAAKKALKVTEPPREKPKAEPVAQKEEKKAETTSAGQKHGAAQVIDVDKIPPVEKPKRSLKKAARKHHEEKNEEERTRSKEKHKKQADVEEEIPQKRHHHKKQEETFIAEGGEGSKSSNKKRRKRKKRKKGPQVKIDEKEIDASIKETLAKMSDTTKKRKHKKDKIKDEIEETEENVIKITEFASVSELANLLDVEANEVIKACMSLGLMVTINQRLDREIIMMVAHEFEYDVVFLTEFGEDTEDQVIFEEEEDESKLHPRAPVVTIMGHVDHGKTSLLDFIRESNIISHESGGITQHIGAYEVITNDNAITFLDTPGHEAFTAMRARGAQVTDMVVLVVAADDGIMPQTIEAINHSRAANVPIVVAINKIDKSGANIDRIKQQLSEHNVLVEDWGGKVQCAEVSAKTGEGIDRLLEIILLESEILELKANHEAKARAVILEARKDKGKGIIGNILIQRGTLNIGDIFIAGPFHGRVRAMIDDRGNKVKHAGPSTPVQVMGFSGMPQAGDIFVVVDSEQEARDISNKRQQLKREQGFKQIKRLTLDQISKNIAEGTVKELAVIIKGDVDGSVEALSDSLMNLATDMASVRIVHKAVGAINESDVLLAEASEAVIIGFHVQPNGKAVDLAKAENIDIRLYEVIYDVVNDVKLALSGLLEPELIEEVTGEVEIRDIFKASKVGMIAGCYVLSGKVLRNSMVRVIRDKEIIHDGKISSLKRFKDDVKEVAAGYECGITLEGFRDIKAGDMFEVYIIIEKAREL